MFCLIFLSTLLEARGRWRSFYRTGCQFSSNHNGGIFILMTVCGPHKLFQKERSDTNPAFQEDTNTFSEGKKETDLAFQWGYICICLCRSWRAWKVSQGHNSYFLLAYLMSENDWREHIKWYRICFVCWILPSHSILLVLPALSHATAKIPH